LSQKNMKCYIGYCITLVLFLSYSLFLCFPCNPSVWLPSLENGPAIRSSALSTRLPTSPTLTFTLNTISSHHNNRQILCNYNKCNRIFINSLSFGSPTPSASIPPFSFHSGYSSY